MMKKGTKETILSLAVHAVVIISWPFTRAAMFFNRVLIKKGKK